MGPNNCATEGLGSVHVMPMTIMAGMKPQCKAVLATGANFCHASSNFATMLPADVTEEGVGAILFNNLE